MNITNRDVEVSWTWQNFHYDQVEFSSSTNIRKSAMDGVEQKDAEKEGSVLIQAFYFLRLSSLFLVSCIGWYPQHKTEKQMAIKSILFLIELW